MFDRTSEQARLRADRRRAERDWASALHTLSERASAADPKLWRMIVDLEEAGDWRVSIAERTERVIGLAYPARRHAGVVPAEDLHLYRVLVGTPEDRLDFME